MNDFGIAVAWSAAQVTLLALAAATLYGITSRRGPATRAPVLIVALGANIFLTGLTLCPLPAWWSWKTAPATPVSGIAPPAEVSSPAADDSPAGSIAATSAVPQSGGLAWPADLLLQTWRRLSTMTIPPRHHQQNWPVFIAVLFLAGAGFGAVRLLLGIWSVHQCCRRSRPIDDPEMNGLAMDVRREMGWPNCVALRESPHLGGPATVGWLRPIILLPVDWPAWTGAERRAALAHELAHVSRADYLARLVARVSAALHFYHPLVSWLAGRLQLQQELAADALAARFAGGRAKYLVALARLALRQEGRPLSWPARALLSSPGTLMRRIAMLQTKDSSLQARPPRGSQAVLVALLATVALGVSALRGPALKAEGDPPAKGAVRAETPAKDVQVEVAETRTGSLVFGIGVNSDAGLTGSLALNERATDSANAPTPIAGAPLKLPYLSADHAGVWSFRPAAIFSRSELKKIIELLNAIHEVKQCLKGVGFEPDAGKFMQSIEQVTGRVSFRTNKQAKGPQSQLLLDLTAVRMVHDFDWKKHLEGVLPGAIAVKHAGRIYYQTPRGALGKGSLGKIIVHLGPWLNQLEICYHIVDGRTVVFDYESNLRSWLEGKRGAVPDSGWREDWKRVEGGLFAFAIDNHDLRWLHDRRPPETAQDVSAAALFRNTSSLVFGFDYTNELIIQALMRSNKEPDAAAAAQAIRQLITESDKDLEPKAPNQPLKGDDALAHRVLKELQEHSRVECQGTSVRWHTAVKLSLADLVTVLISDE